MAFYYYNNFFIFAVDASDAGQGTLDFSVGPPGKTIPHDQEYWYTGFPGGIHSNRTCRSRGFYTVQ